jgi:hypothetical protein
MTTTAQIETGTLYANVAERIVSGLLLPYGEQGKTNLGKFSINAGAVTIPSDPSIVTVNTQHDRENPVGRATELLDTAAGIVGTFSIAATPEGDTVLAEIASGKRSKLSAEVKNIVIRAGAAVSGSLFGAAIVEQGAFPSAALLASDTPDAVVNVNDQGEVIIAADANPDAILVETVLPDGTLDTSVYTEDTAPPPTDPNQNGASNVASATAPDMLQAHRLPPESVNLSTISDTLTNALRNGSRSMFAELMSMPDSEASSTLFGALSDVKISGTGAVGTAIMQPQWIGELWSGRAFERKIIPLLGSGSLSSLKISGWRWTVKPKVSTWAGNKSNVPSNAPATESYEVNATRWAGAHDIAKEYRDFDVPGFWEGYFKGMTESYAKATDEATLAALLAGATQVVATAATENLAWSRIIDGIDAVIEETVPTFAIVAKDLYRDLLMTKNNDALNYLNATVGFEAGSSTGFQLIPSSYVPAGSVLVGSREAATSHELPGAPVRVEAIDMVKGGVDVGLFGYHAVVLHDAGALALVTPAAVV